MLLSRFMSHLKEQNWFAVIIDVIVVIVGIFLGLQVTNWQQHLNERNDARHYLERLHDDLQADLTNIDNRKVFWGKVINYVQQAMQYMEQPNQDYKAHWPYLLATFQSSPVKSLPWRLPALPIMNYNRLARSHCCAISNCASIWRNIIRSMTVSRH